MYFGTPLYWRETHKQPRLLIFDGRLIVLLLGVILYVRIWTILLALSAMIVLFLFDRKGVPADSILRYLRARLVGRRRSARGHAAERRAVDFGFETPAMVKRVAEAHEKLARARAEQGFTTPQRKKSGVLAKIGLGNA